MRSIRPQTVTLAVLAILFGLIAAWAARQVLFAKREALPQVAAAPLPEPKVEMLILQSNLVADARIRDQDVGQVPASLEEVKKRNIPLEKAFTFKQQAVGRILKKAKNAGSWLSSEDFYDVGKGPQLKLKEGQRAVTLRIDDPAVPSDLIQAGCLVDVIFTTEHPDSSSKLTLRLFSGMEVLSPPVTEGGLPNPVTSVSKKSYIVLAATPEQANRLALAQQMVGTISVALCAVPPGDDGTRLDSRRVDALLSSGEHPIGERELLNLPPLPAPPAQPERIIVEQFRGNKIDYVVFTDDNVRLSQEEARRDSLRAAAANGATAKPPKKCKNCEKAAEKAAKEKSKRDGGEATPVPDTTPSPTPAPQNLRNSPSPDPEPTPPRTT